MVPSSSSTGGASTLNALVAAEERLGISHAPEVLVPGKRESLRA